MTLPVNPATPSETPMASGGDVPVRPCPQPDPVEYTFDFGAGFLEQDGDHGARFGVSAGSWSPDPDPGLSFSLAMALPITPRIVGAPTRADVPGSWISLGPPSDPVAPDDVDPVAPDDVGASLPIPLPISVPGYTPGDDLWLRLSIVTPEQTTIVVWLYAPTGLPADTLSDWTVFVGAEGAGFEELTVPAHADTGPGGVDDTTFVTTGVQDSPTYGVAVTNACDDNPLRVVTLDEPIAVTFPALTEAVVTAGFILGDGAGDNVQVAAGANSITLHLFGTASDLFVWGAACHIDDGDLLTFTAPPGKTLPLCSLAVAGDGAVLDWVRIE